jgi:nucleotide-binding universal stress UspA family protein
MPRYDRILFPVDFSDRCRGAANYVEAFARRFRSEVTLLHVVESHIGQAGDLAFGASAALQEEDRLALAGDMLRDFRLSDDIPVHRLLERGDPATTIIRLAQEQQTDLIMMPTHGYGGFRRFLLGSVTAKVLHDAACPVWTGVHMDDVPEAKSLVITRVMCAVDLREASGSVLNAALELAASFGADAAIAHAVPGSDAIPERLLDAELRTHLQAQAREQIHSLLPAGVPATVLVEAGEVAPALEAVARNYGADLLVIGRGQHRGFGRLRTHSYSIIRQSPCPVLSI